MTSNYSGKFYSTAKTYERRMKGLVKHIFKNEDKNTYRVVDIDTESDTQRRVLIDLEFNMNYDNIEKKPDWVSESPITIRLWNIKDTRKGVLINYTTYWTKR